MIIMCEYINFYHYDNDYTDPLITVCIIESVDSVSGDGTDMVYIL